MQTACLSRYTKNDFSKICFYLLLCTVISVVGVSSSFAKKKEITVPVEVGVGPAGHIIFGGVQERQAVFYGARLNLEAIINKALIQENKKKVPKKYRKMAMKLNEVRLRPGPLAYIPKTLYISPGENSMYGAMWDLLGLGTGFGPLKLSADLQFLYAYLSLGAQEKLPEQSMHLLRPALGLTAHIPIMFTDSFGIDLGWRSTFMPPQEIGESPLSFSTDLDKTVWHIGQAYLAITFRIPYTTRM